jgi:hypothetical protein
MRHFPSREFEFDINSGYLRDSATGLKILGSVKRPCRFKSGPGHQTALNFNTLPKVLKLPVELFDGTFWRMLEHDCAPGETSMRLNTCGLIIVVSDVEANRIAVLSDRLPGEL